ncbi:ABC transporter permease [Bifidobacterium eulemuris]|uniref:ABC transporter permease n=1 Tax=Bifidobacterium eulemuris TaxID=1765219 RepID=A0A261GB49_9BIFI|nr:ABC transporter permease [Bifidobacterium eulemuris]OZG68630.1 ABC transporter permease [Bifidobacterium eulemuris]QOL32748.1 ABC transporter permease [Bifidobacterium eulemuris]
MTIALNIVRLRWALTFAAMRKSVWQTVGYVVCLAMGAMCVIGVAVGAFVLGFGPDLMGSSAGEAATVARDYASVTRCVVVIVAACLLLFVAAIQLMLIGEGSSLSPKKFELYGIEDRTLQFGLLLAGLAGAPAIGGTLAFALWAMAYRWMGPVPVLVAVVAAPLAVVTMISISRMIISLATSMVTSTRGRTMFYIVTTVVFILLCQMPSIVLNTSVDNEGFDTAALMAGGTMLADILAWTPLAAAFQLPFDAFAGAWLPLCGRLAVLALTWVVCFMVCTWCLRRERLVAGRDAATATIKGIGAFSWMPDSPSGAISARLLISMRRDPRLSVMFLMPLLFVVIFGIQSHGLSVMIWQSLTWMGLFMMMIEGNGLAYDGGGFTMQVLAGVRGRDDRFGRVRVYATFSLVYMLILSLGIFAFTGDWRTGDGLALGLVCTSIGIGVVFAGLGLAEVLSCVLMYPVPSIEKPFSSPQGRMAAQGFFPFAHLFGSIILMLPTGIVALVLGLAVGDAMVMLAGVAVAALVNGVVALLVGSWLGGKLMDARMVKIVQTLESFASLQK